MIDPETSPLLLRKGLEEEVYTGTPDGRVVGLSAKIAADLPGFSTEPDARNVEYVTEPYRDYRRLVDRLMAKRCRLRRYLADLDSYTLVPGGTLPLERGDEFVISNHDNPYYRYIRDSYGLRVVTASTHINVGIEDPIELLRACRVIRCEAASFLALSAASPFVRGEVSGHHSTRWTLFPETPEVVPFFTDPQHFVRFVEEKLRDHEMYNPRHLWLSVRPNGPATPYELSRLELRICDRLSQPRVVAGIVALLEARVWQVLEDPSLDPLRVRDDAELRGLVRANERDAAHRSLDADFLDWQTGERSRMSDWLAARCAALRPVARAHGFERHLDGVDEILAEGNLAQRWLVWHHEGMTPQQVIARAIVELAAIDRQYDACCPGPV
jgi:predicted glutamate--cysteine ligase